jgi:glycosyltransferase involved in cell wall biosynthesis
MSEEKLRILYCESCMDGTVGGSHHCLLHLLESLDRTQYDPLVLFYQEHALLSRFKATADTMVRTRTMDMPVQWGAGWRRGRLPFVLARRAVNLVKFALTILEHALFLKRRRIALVHLNNSITRHHEWMCAALLARVPCVVSERGINGRYTFLDRWLARRLALIIPVSCWVMNHMVRHGVASENMRVLYDGIDAASIKPARPADSLRDAYGVRSQQPVVGIVGNVRAWKGQETVVRAIIDVAKVFPEVVCFFVGASTPEDKPYLDHLQGLIKSAGIESNVRFTGYQSDPASFINLMQVVIHASIQPEPFGMVVLEAMAQRKPVVGSRAGGPVEMVQEGETGYTYPPGDAAALSSRIVELLNSPDKAARMGEAGYKRLMTMFTLEGYMDDIHAVYRAILGRQALPSDRGIRFSQDRHATV